MRCPICESDNTKVTNVREHDYKLYRRRKCLECDEKFTTYEIDLGTLMELFEDQFDLATSGKIAEILEQSFPTRSRLSV